MKYTTPVARSGLKVRTVHLHTHCQHLRNSFNAILKTFFFLSLEKMRRKREDKNSILLKSGK
jgi:hypothetical protein